MSSTLGNRAARVTSLSDESLQHLASGGMRYLYGESIPGGLSQPDFITSQAVAKFVLEVAEHFPKVLAKLSVGVFFVCPHAPW